MNAGYFCGLTRCDSDVVSGVTVYTAVRITGVVGTGSSITDVICVYPRTRSTLTGRGGLNTTFYVPPAFPVNNSWLNNTVIPSKHKSNIAILGHFHGRRANIVTTMSRCLLFDGFVCLMDSSIWWIVLLSIMTYVTSHYRSCIRFIIGNVYSLSSLIDLGYHVFKCKSVTYA